MCVKYNFCRLARYFRIEDEEKIKIPQPSVNKILQILFNLLGKQRVWRVHCKAWQHLISAQ